MSKFEFKVGDIVRRHPDVKDREARAMLAAGKHYTVQCVTDVGFGDILIKIAGKYANGRTPNDGLLSERFVLVHRPVPFQVIPTRVGQIVMRLQDGEYNPILDRLLTRGKKYKVAAINGNCVQLDIPTYEDGTGVGAGIEAHRFTVVQDVPVSAEGGQARASDPSTSKRAAKIKRGGLRVTLLAALIGAKRDGLTGHEAANKLGRPLNSITPRFAELRKSGHIVDSSKRRNGQIVWVHSQAAE